MANIFAERRAFMLSREQANQISIPVLLIGLGVLAITKFWFPGIMFVIGVFLVMRGLADGRGWYALQGGLLMFAIGISFLGGGFNWPLLLILMGVNALVGSFLRSPDRVKAKNEELAQKPEEREVEDEYIVGDDGELVKVKNDAKIAQSSGKRQ
jgi:hypothetical protein